jgi:hypothetical protein
VRISRKYRRQEAEHGISGVLPNRLAFGRVVWLRFWRKDGVGRFGVFVGCFGALFRVKRKKVFE